MGDFNDEPFNTSLVIHALSARQRQRVVDDDNPRLWNLSWSVIGDPTDETFYFNNEPNLLDQFLVNKNMARQNDPIRAKADTVEILRFPGAPSPASTSDQSRSAGWANRSTKTGSQTTFRSGCRSPRPTRPVAAEAGGLRCVSQLRHIEIGGAMASDAANNWICPSFHAEGSWTGQVWVMNPNKDAAKVTITFHDQMGPELYKAVDTIWAGETMWYQPFDQWGDMWVRVQSNKPVLPAGYYPTTAQDDQYVDATFYRVEGTQLIQLPPTVVAGKKRQQNQRTVAPQPDR
jgi:hypothetical protein